MNSDSKTIIHALESYGFERNEAIVYVALLKRLEATAFELAKETGIPRSTVYTILESLKKQGVISPFRKNNVAYFTPESPNQLLNLLKKKEEVINDIMPSMRAITSRKMDVPVAKLYVGLDGVKTGLENVLETIRDKKVKQIYATSSQPDFLTYMPKYFSGWLKRREALGVSTKLINTQAARDYLKPNMLREIRFLPKDFPFVSSVIIYANKLAFFSLEKDDPYCVIIESASITAMFTQFFLFTWKMLERKN